MGSGSTLLGSACNVSSGLSYFLFWYLVSNPFQKVYFIIFVIKLFSFQYFYNERFLFILNFCFQIMFLNIFLFKFFSQILFPKFFNTKFLCFLDLCSQFFASKFYVLFILNLIFFAAIFLISILFVKKNGFRDKMNGRRGRASVLCWARNSPARLDSVDHGKVQCLAGSTLREHRRLDLELPQLPS